MAKDLNAAKTSRKESDKKMNEEIKELKWLCAQSWCTIKNGAFARLYFLLSPLIIEIEKRFLTCNTILVFCTSSIIQRAAKCRKGS